MGGGGGGGGVREKGARFMSMSLRCFSALCNVACKRSTTDRQQ